jgi:hypothetical protein
MADIGEPLRRRRVVPLEEPLPGEALPAPTKVPSEPAVPAKRPVPA